MIPILCQIRQAVKSPAFHAGNVGSIPASGTYPTKGKRDEIRKALLFSWSWKQLLPQIYASVM